MTESTIDHSASGDLTLLAGVADGDQFSVQVGAATVATITINTGDTIAQIATELSAVADVTATVVNGRLQIEATNGEDLTLADVTNTPLDDLGLAPGVTAGAVNPTRQSLATQYDELLNQIDELAEDAGFNGVNLLQNNNLQVLFNEDGTSELIITGVDFDSGGLAINASTNDFQDKASVDAALGELDTAIKALRSQASTFGSNLTVVETRQNFTKQLINTLETGAANLTVADTNEEGANMLALQTRQSLSLYGPVARFASRSERAPPLRLGAPDKDKDRQQHMALKIDIKSGERIIVGTAVITNAGSRAKLEIEGSAPILREKDIMRPDDADTPCKRIYFTVLMMYLSEDPNEYFEQFFELVRDTQTAAPSTIPYIMRIHNEILTGSYYKALKEAKTLTEYEKELLENARSGSSL